MAKTATTKAPTAAAAESKQCACGCGEPVVRLFKQGHDQKLVAKFASDLVYMNVWDGRCMGILKVKESRSDIEVKIDTVSAYVSEKLSEALGTKVYKAAMRAWELQKNADERASKRAERTKAAAEKKATRKPRPTKPVATNADVDAVEATPSEEAGDASTSGLGADIRVRVGKRARTAQVHGMNQAGKVTAIRYKVGNNEITKTEGQFEVLGD